MQELHTRRRRSVSRLSPSPRRPPPRLTHWSSSPKPAPFSVCVPRCPIRVRSQPRSPGPSYKRGPPKGYIHAIEQRWHQVESILGAILASPDPQVRHLIKNLKRDDLARDILNRVDSGPFVSPLFLPAPSPWPPNRTMFDPRPFRQGPTGRLNHSVAVTKEDFFASILNSADPQAARDPSRPRRQSRVSREIVSSSASTPYPLPCSSLQPVALRFPLPDNSALVSPTLEWQDRLSSRFALIGPSANNNGHRPSRASSERERTSGPSLPQRRRLDGDASLQPDWDRMYRMDRLSGDPVFQFDPATDTHPPPPLTALPRHLRAPDSSEEDKESEDSSCMFGQLSLDENKEVRRLSRPGDR